MRKRIYLWLILAVGIGIITWKLYSNKQQLAAESEFSRVTNAFVPVEVVQPQLEMLSNHLEADGIFLPFKEMFVISETAGRVLEVFKNKGEWVTEGTIIAKVDASPPLQHSSMITFNPSACSVSGSPIKAVSFAF